MKNDKARNTMMLIAGGYLVYLGFTLVQDVMTEAMDNGILFLMCGILFIAAGAYVVVARGKDLIQFNYDEMIGDESEDTIEEQTPLEIEPTQQESGVVSDKDEV